MVYLYLHLVDLLGGNSLAFLFVHSLDLFKLIETSSKAYSPKLW